MMEGGAGWGLELAGFAGIVRTRVESGSVVGAPAKRTNDNQSQRSWGSQDVTCEPPAGAVTQDAVRGSAQQPREGHDRGRLRSFLPGASLRVLSCHE